MMVDDKITNCHRDRICLERALADILTVLAIGGEELIWLPAQPRRRGDTPLHKVSHPRRALELDALDVPKCRRNCIEQSSQNDWALRLECSHQLLFGAPLVLGN